MYICFFLDFFLTAAQLPLVHLKWKVKKPRRRTVRVEDRTICISFFEEMEKNNLLFSNMELYIYIFFFTIINREIHSVELPEVVATTRKKCVSVLTWQSPARRNADVSFNSEMASGQTSTGKEEKPKHHTDTIAPLFIIESHPDLKRPLQRQR